MRRHVLVLAGGSIAICLAMSLLFAGTASALSTGNGAWQWQNPLPQGNAYTGGYFLDASHGWLISGGDCDERRICNPATNPPASSSIAALTPATTRTQIARP